MNYEQPDADGRSDLDNTAIYNRGVCIGYLRATFDVHRSYVEYMNAKPMFCLPDKIFSLADVARSIVEFARENPDDVASSPGSFALVSLTLMQTYPCEDQ